MASPCMVKLARFVGGNIKLEEIDLDDTQVKWLGISHVWGPTQLVKWRKLKFMKNRVFCTPHKKKFLEQELIQLVNGSHFWMDIICVDQSNKIAQTAVTGLIPKIYDGARATIAIRDGDGIPRCCAKLLCKDLGSACMFHPETDNAELRQHIQNYPGHETRCNQESYLRRLWPLQELMLSRKIIFVSCGRWKAGQYMDGPSLVHPAEWDSETDSSCTDDNLSDDDDNKESETYEIGEEILGSSDEEVAEENWSTDETEEMISNLSDDGSVIDLILPSDESDEEVDEEPDEESAVHEQVMPRFYANWLDAMNTFEGELLSLQEALSSRLSGTFTRADFYRAFLLGRQAINLEGRQNLSEPFLELSERQFASGRTTGKSKDFFLALMPQYNWYTVPKFAASMSFGDLYSDLHAQARSHGHEFCPRIMAGLTTDQECNRSSSKPSLLGTKRTYPTPSCSSPSVALPSPHTLGDFFTLIGGLPSSYRERPFALACHFTGAHVVSALALSGPAEIFYIIRESWRFSRLYFSRFHATGVLNYVESFMPETVGSECCLGHLQIAETKYNIPLRAFRECAAILDQFHPKIELTAALRQRLSRLTASHKHILLYMATLFGCGFHLYAYQWAVERLHPVIVSFPDRMKTHTITVLGLVPSSSIRKSPNTLRSLSSFSDDISVKSWAASSGVPSTKFLVVHREPDQKHTNYQQDIHLISSPRGPAPNAIGILTNFIDVAQLPECTHVVLRHHVKDYFLYRNPGPPRDDWTCGKCGSYITSHGSSAGHNLDTEDSSVEVNVEDDVGNRDKMMTLSVAVVKDSAGTQAPNQTALGHERATSTRREDSSDLAEDSIQQAIDECFQRAAKRSPHAQLQPLQEEWNEFAWDCIDRLDKEHS